VGLDARVMQLDESSRDRKRDPQTALGAVEPAIRLREQVSYPQEHLGRDADAGVSDAHDDLLALALGN
jgi:hypothetical protein